MPLSWNEIRDRAIRFSKEWASASSEQGDRQTFWNEFFEVFGIKRKTVASFEEPVKKLSGQWGFIDLFWKGMLLVEHKSRGKSLEKATSQAMDYIQSLVGMGRQDESPRYVIMSDFDQIALHDLEEGTSLQFQLAEFHKHINAFGFIPGYKQQKLGAVEDPINVRAVELMGELHDALEEGGYKGHKLERFLVRILFCLFSEDTGIFERNAFTELILNHTREDGSDLGDFLAKLFDVLNTPQEDRQKHLLEEMQQLAYVNGRLFEENLGFASMNKAMRDKLLKCCNLDWGRISPAVFGSLFQSVMDSKERRQVGAHYTSERDILKVIDPLFMDDLREEFEKVKHDKRKLKAFHEKLGNLKFLDPACGCGNFLVVAYRELRLLEIEILRILLKDQKVTDVGLFSLIDVDCMHGIELLEFPALIAEVAMWLIDHQMNVRLSEAFGQYFVRLPLKKSAKIAHANALRVDWRAVLPREECSYVMGNPPFVGAKWMNDEQRTDMRHITGFVANSGLLDFVTAWYFVAAKYVDQSSIQVAFVSTNSISQGEQVGVLWGALSRLGMKINFAYRPFAWLSEARGKAQVHVVIIGFGAIGRSQKWIYETEATTEAQTKSVAKTISPYLVEGAMFALTNRSAPICDVPAMVSGNKPIDGGNFFFTPEEKRSHVEREPMAEPYFKRWIGGDEFLNGLERWFLYLNDCPPEELRKMPLAQDRIKLVREFRAASKSKTTQAIANTPTRFHTTFAPKGDFLAMPQVSSERRRYIPVAYLGMNFLPGDKLRCVSNATIWHFGVLTSSMHMAWVNRVTGRLESRYQYSAKLVYNNFPWPQSPTDKQKEAVEAKAQAVLDARANHPNATLADLYDPLTMPADLVKAHEQLDRAVELCYRPKPFASDRERVEFLFELYEKLTAPLTAEAKPSKSQKRNNQ